MYDKKIIIELLKFIKENLNSDKPEEFTEKLFIEKIENLNNQKLVNILKYLYQENFIDGIQFIEFDQTADKLNFHSLKLTEKGENFLKDNSFPRNFFIFLKKLSVILIPLIGIAIEFFSLLKDK